MIRLLLVCLLALALPAQGAMAATMSRCAAHQHDRTAAAALGQHESVTHAHGRVVDGFSANAATAPDGLAKAGMHKCSACASCCSAAATDDTLPKLPVLDPAVSRFVVLACAVEPFAASGPERPPRAVLA